MKKFKSFLLFMLLGFTLAVISKAIDRFANHLPMASVDIEVPEVNSTYQLEEYLRKDGCYELGLASDEDIFYQESPDGDIFHQVRFDGEYKLEFFHQDELLDTHIISKARAIRRDSDTSYTKLIFDVIKVPMKAHAKLRIKMTILKPETSFSTLEDSNPYFYLDYAPDLMCGERYKAYLEEERIAHLTIDTNETNESLLPLYQALQDKNLAEVKKAIESGVSVNVKMIGERTPLHFSAHANDRATSEYLLNRGADMEAKDIHQRTALYYAIDNNATGTAELLLKKEATLPELVYWIDKNGKVTSAGYPPLFYASCNMMFEMAELLLQDRRIDKHQFYEQRNASQYATVCVKRNNMEERKVYDEKVNKIRTFLRRHGVEPKFDGDVSVKFEKEKR